MILHDTTGDYRFIVRKDGKNEEVRFTDIKDIPEGFDYLHLIKFVGNIPLHPILSNNTSRSLCSKGSSINTSIRSTSK